MLALRAQRFVFAVIQADGEAADLHSCAVHRVDESPGMVTPKDEQSGRSGIHPDVHHFEGAEHEVPGSLRGLSRTPFLDGRVGQEEGTSQTSARTQRARPKEHTSLGERGRETPALYH